MAKYHIKSDGTIDTCSANPSNPNAKGCPFGGETEHFSTKKEAIQYNEEKLSKEYENSSLKKPIKYSFLKDFEEKEKEFNADFEGFPTRFFKADLRHNFFPKEKTDYELVSEEKERIEAHKRRCDAGLRTAQEMYNKALEAGNEERAESALKLIKNYSDDKNTEERSLEELRQAQKENIEKWKTKYSYKKIAHRLATFASSTDDLTNDLQKIQRLAKDLNMTDVQEITDDLTLKSIGIEKGFYAKDKNGAQIVIVGDKALSSSKALQEYHFRNNRRIDQNSRPPLNPRESFVMVDSRTLAGMIRTQRKTGINVFENSLNVQPQQANMSTIERTIYYQEKREKTQKARDNIYTALTTLETAQREGANFQAQKKYVKDHQGKIATAWMDKKNPDKIHQEIMKNSKLNKIFKKIEIDNDVDPKEFADFENAYTEISHKLPPFTKGKEPELKVRKLGKHKATGVYFPHKNIIAIDVKTSGSFIHEMAHQYDLTIKNNASLRKEFNEIINQYTHQLKLPPELQNKKEYYSTPTEVFARGFEHYAHQKLGINNRLLDVNKFQNPDHIPFQSQELKEKMFNFIDKLYNEK